MDTRRRTRVSAHKQTTLTWPGGQCVGEIVNLSLKGCLLRAGEQRPPPQGQEVELLIHLESELPGFDVRIHAKVVRQEGVDLALDFSEIELDSFQHLFRLVQYNAPNPDSIEQELGTSAFRPGADKTT